MTGGRTNDQDWPDARIHGRMSDRHTKITFAEMRDIGVRAADLLLRLQVQPPGHHERRPMARRHAAVRLEPRFIR